MTRKEQTRVKLLNEVNEGVAAMAHGNRGRQPAHRIDVGTCEQVRALAGRQI